MSPEERDELMQFILECQSKSAEWQREFEERHRQFEKDIQDLWKSIQAHDKQFEVLASATRDLVEVARIHSRRLDRLEGL